MELERHTTVKGGERPVTRWQRNSQDSQSLRGAFDRPQTGVPRLQSRIERPTSRRGLKNEIQDFNIVSSTFHTGMPGRNFLSRPPPTSISSNRVSTTSSRLSSGIGLTRLNTGLSANSFVANASSMDRPVTQQGIAAARPSSTRGIPRMARQIQDKRYYEGLVQLKIRELTQEISIISREIDTQNKERVTFLHYDQRAKDLAAELTELQGQLADYNIVIDKMTSDTDKNTIELEAKELAQSNNLTLSEIEVMFERCQHKEKQLLSIEKAVAAERKNAERIVESMDQDAREKYDKLHSQKTKLQGNIDEIQHDLDNLSIEKMSLEEKIVLSQVKQEAVRLQTKIMEIKEKRDRLREEEKNKLSPEEEKDHLLQKVKQDNVDIVASERRIAELEKRLIEVEQELEQLQIDLGEDRSEKLIKYKELRKREEVMEDFMSPFEENKKEELKKLKKLEAVVIDRLENISSEIDGEVQLTNNQELGVLNIHRKETRKNDQDFEDLRQEYFRLQRMIMKLENLEKRLKTEQEDLEEKIDKCQSELIVLEDLDSLKTKSKAKTAELLEKRNELKIQQPACERELQIVQTEYNEIKCGLNKNETFLQINALEDKLKKIKESIVGIQNSIVEKNERMNYHPVKFTVTMEDDVLCTICDEPLQNGEGIATVHSRGLATFIDKSKSREDEKYKRWEGKESMKFHEKCRKRYSALKKTNKRKEESPLPSLDSPTTSNDSSDFNFEQYCFICNRILDRCHKKVSTLQHLYTYQNIVKVASAKNNELGRAVCSRLQNTTFKENFFHYHYTCYKHFLYKHSEMPPDNEIAEYEQDPGPPNVDDESDNVIDAICSYIEDSGKFQFSLSELHDLNQTKITNKVLCNKLKDRYNDDILILKHRGRETLIYYKTINLTQICSDWVSKKSINDFEKNAVIHFAAEILRSEILNAKYENSEYPPASKFLDSVNSEIPQLLKNFLNDLLLNKGKKKSIAETQEKIDMIAHSIVAFTRPRVFLSKLQLALGVYIYRKTGSRIVIDLLSKFGVSASYASIQLYEASTIVNPPIYHIDSAFVQFIFDNTDHNVGTLDGRETFHCLGGIAVYTPDFEVVVEGGSKKCTKMPTAKEISMRKKIQTVPFGSIESAALKNIEFRSVEALRLGDRPIFPVHYTAYSWGKALHNSELPSWKGFMEIITADIDYSLSKIVCLPFINLPPSELTTLNTALHHAAEETRKIGQTITFVTFDQPLYWKARCIIAQSSELKNVVVRLGGFHLLMSYLGAIGYIMDGSGLEEMWSMVYASESVKKMITGHAFSRAMRAHILSFTAIAIIICNSITNIDGVDAFFVKFVKAFAEKKLSIKKINTYLSMKLLTGSLIEKLDSLKNKNSTAKLWIQYFKCVTVALQFMEAERLGNWQLHLQSIKDMLPIFYSSGHFAYAKCAQIYLQDMANLDTMILTDETCYEIERYTKNGYFTIRRSDKAWSGVWSDMIIEQTLNRFFGTDLKHGRGVTPSVVARYLFSMPSVFNVMECLENYCGLKSHTSEQHVDLSNSRMKRDTNDINEFVTWLQNHKPFNQQQQELVSLSTGVIGGPEIDCHKAIEKGQLGMTEMVDKNADNISLSRIFKVKNLASATISTHLEDNTEIFTVDIYLLFERICVAFKKDPQKTLEAFAHELTPYPLSLFDEKGLMRKSQKAKIYDLFKSCNNKLQLMNFDMTYVIDGGWLLHAVVWPHNSTYEEVFKTYLLYIHRNFGKNVTVVFDGYNNELIGVKSYERYCRREKNIGADVEIFKDKIIPIGQKKFLSNIRNKLAFVELLVNYLKTNNIDTKIAEEDADTVIVRTAIELKDDTGNLVTVVGNDVDLLILLIAQSDSYEIYFYKRLPNSKNVLYSSKENSNFQKYILFAHAFAGCDSTSAIYNKGKKSIITLLQKDEDLQRLICIFYKPDKTIDDMFEVAKKLVMKLYGADDESQSLEEFRYSSFSKLVAVAKKQVSLKYLPPTTAVLREHVKRVYYQMQMWLGFQLDPVFWGWKRTSNMMIPIMNTEPVAPKDLIEMVFCGCKTDCNTSRCSCKKAGIKCSYSCKNCNGQICENAADATPIILENDVEEREQGIGKANEDMSDDEGSILQEENVYDEDSILQEEDVYDEDSILQEENVYDSEAEE